MHFNPKALLITATFLLLFTAALNGSSWGIAGCMALLVIQAWVFAGSYGFLDFFRILKTGRINRN